MDWLKKNWILIVFVVIIVVVVSGWVNSCNDNKDYEAKIKELNESITALEEREREALEDAENAIRDAEEWENSANEKDKEIGELKKILKKLQDEKNDLEEKIKKLTPDQIVTRTREIIKSNEVNLQKIGVVFSIFASRKNLGILEEFSICKQENSTLEKSFSECQDVVKYLRNSISSYKKSIKKWKTANDSCNEIKIDLKQKFELCEKSRKNKWWKGFFNGAAVGGGIIALLAILAK